MYLIARGYTRGFCFCICTLVVGLDYYWDFIREAILLLSIAKYIRGVLRLKFSEPPYSMSSTHLSMIYLVQIRLSTEK